MVTAVWYLLHTCSQIFFTVHLKFYFSWMVMFFFLQSISTVLFNITTKNSLSIKTPHPLCNLNLNLIPSELYHPTFWKTSEIVEFVFPGIGEEIWVVPERGPLWSPVLPVQPNLQVYVPFCPYPRHDFFGNQRLQNKFEYKIIISTILICNVSTLTLMRESAGKGIEKIAFKKAPKMSFLMLCCNS